jgi:voltage-dependent calcium channel alpha-2/delta-3
LFIEITVAYPDSDYPPDPTERMNYDLPATKSKEQEFDKRVLINRTRPEKCDKIFTLYQLMRAKEKEKSAFDLPMSKCDRPYIVLPIRSSNMLLYVGLTTCSKSEDLIPFYNIPIPKDYNDSLHCHRMKTTPIYRRQLKHCFSQHQNESQIELCGNASKSHLSLSVVLLTILVTLKYFV